MAGTPMPTAIKARGTCVHTSSGGDYGGSCPASTAFHGSIHDAGVGLLEGEVHGSRADHAQHVLRKVHGSSQLGRLDKLCSHMRGKDGSVHIVAPSRQQIL